METEKVLSIEKLSAANWYNWKFKMEIILKENDLFDIVTGKGGEGNNAKQRQEYQKKLDKAYRTIVLSVSDQYLGLLREAGNAIKAWKSLCDNFERGCLTNQRTLWRRFVNLKYNIKDDMQTHVNKLIELRYQLEGVGHKINTMMMIMVLLDSLPKDYENLVIALETQKELVDFDFVCNRVLEEFGRRKSQVTNDNEDDQLAFNANEKGKEVKFNGKCNYCHKFGHMAKNCFKKKAQMEKDKKYEIKEDTNKNKCNIVESEYEALMVHENETNCDWVVDSGATNHMCFRFDWFINYKQLEGKKVTIANGSQVEVIGEGDVLFCDKDTGKRLMVNGVLHIPTLTQNLLSVSKMTMKGLKVIFTIHDVKVFRNNIVILKARNENGIFKIKSFEQYLCCKTGLNDDVLIWHKRLGHISKTGMIEMVKQNLLPVTGSVEFNCESCILGKQTREPFASSETKSESILDLVHTDVCGPLPVESLNGNKYFITFLDDYSHFTFIYFMKKRDEVSGFITKFITFVTNQTGRKLKIIRSDGAKENLTGEIRNLFQEKGIKHQKTCPYTPQQNGKAERLNRTLLEITRSMLIEANLNDEFWAEAMNTAVYLLNRRPSSSINNKIPFELWYNKKLELKNLKVFGCICYVLTPKLQRNKLAPRSSERIFIGYDDDYKGYKVIDLETHRIYMSRDVVFNEEKFPVQEKHDEINSAFMSNEIPRSFFEAMRRNDSQEWIKACNDEMKSLRDKGTWILVSRTPGMKLIRCKWVFTIKTKGNGEIDRYKARLVAKGFTQHEGIDYHETFAPVTKLTSIRLIFKLAMIEKMQIRQIDIKTAFLNGKIEEDLFMMQPEGFDDQSGRVCKLLKGIYGLKQASNAWNSEINGFILETGFKRCISDSCIYSYNEDDIKCFIVLYVDDLIILSTSSDFIGKFIAHISSRYETKVMDKFEYFLGINIVHDQVNHSIQMNQSKYINEILEKFEMNDCKTVSTPIDPNVKLCKEADQLDNILKSKYQQIVGSIHYLVTCSRPDLAIVTCILSQFLSSPSNSHYTIAKRVLRYLKGTSKFGIILESNKTQHLVLESYVDADWGGNFEDKRSATGYLFYLNSNLISWNTKKQQTIALSTTEAEYMAETEAVKEVIWLKSLMNELGYEVETPIDINCDNQGSIKLAKNPVFHSRTKHIDIRHHFIRDQIENGLVRLKYVQSSANKADIMTKPLASPKFHEFLGLLLHEMK